METDDESRPANIQAVATPPPANEDEEGEWSDEATPPVEDSGKGSPAIGFLSLPRRKKIILLSVGTAQFCVMCDVALLSPLYPIEADKRNVSGTLTGWVFGVFALTQFFVSPFLGKYMRTIGPKFAYVAGALLTGGCTVLLGSLDWLPGDGDSTFLALSFVLQVVMACGVTSLQTSAYVLATREFSDNVNFVFGLSEAFVGLGLTAGPEIAGALYQVGGFYLPFVVMGSVTLLTIPFNLLLVHTPPALQSVAATQSNTASRTLRHPSTWVIVLVTIMGGVIWGVLEPSLEPHLSLLDLEPEMLGLVFLLLPAIYSLCCPLVGWLSEKVADGKYVIIPGLVLSAASLCLLGPASFLNQDPDNPSLWLNVGALVLHGVAMSLAVIPTYSLLMTQAREACEGEDVGVHSLVAGLWCSSYAFGEFVGPVYGGVILDTVGFADGLSYVALVCLAVAFLVVGVGVWSCIRRGMKKKKKKKKATTSEDLDENSPLLPEKKPPSPPPPPPPPPLPPPASAGQQRRKKRERSSEKRPSSCNMFDNEAVFAYGGRKTPKFSLQRKSVISPPPVLPQRVSRYQGGRKTPGTPSQRPISAPPLRESVPSLLFQGSVAVLDASP